MGYIEDSNVIIVRDTIRVHRRFTQILDRIDIEAGQVFVDVKFVSTANVDLLDLGVDYGDGGPQVNVSGGQIPIQLPFGLAARRLAERHHRGPRRPGALRPMPFGTAQILAPSSGHSRSPRVSAAKTPDLQRDTRGEGVVQAPKIITLDGNEAAIFDQRETVRWRRAPSKGRPVVYSLSVQARESGSAPVEVGFQLLDAVPNVIPGTRKIMMEVIPKETNLSGSSPGTPAWPRPASTCSPSVPTAWRPSPAADALVDAHHQHDAGEWADGRHRRPHQRDRPRGGSRVPLPRSDPSSASSSSYTNRTRDRRSLVIFVTPQLNRAEGHLLQPGAGRRRSSLKDEGRGPREPLLRRSPGSLSPFQGPRGRRLRSRTGPLPPWRGASRSCGPLGARSAGCLVSREAAPGGIPTVPGFNFRHTLGTMLPRARTGVSSHARRFQS